MGSNAGQAVPQERGKRFRDWVTFFLAVLGSLLGFLNFVNSRKAEVEQQRLASEQRRLEANQRRSRADQLLNAAWDFLGGGEGSYEVSEFERDPKKLELARRKIREAQSLDDKYPRVYWMEGSLAAANQRNEDSIALNRRAIELDKTAAIPHSHIGMVLIEQGKLDEAAAEFEIARHLEPESPSPLCSLCWIRLKQGQLDEAAKLCENALQIGPTWRQTYKNLALVREAQGRRDDARELRLKAKRLEGNLQKEAE